MKVQLKEQLQVFQENAVDLISAEELILKLEKSISSFKPLKIKIGFDPTAKDLHLGHSVLLRKLRKLQELGHIVYFIVGDFTAKIGDPTGRNSLRPVLTDEEILLNASTYTEQAFKILERTKTKIIYNSVWYKEMKLENFLSLLSSYTLAQVLEREDFSARLKNNQPLSLLEIVYPLIQGYDSFKLEADVEFGGTDQKFNLLVARYIQKVFGQTPQVIITMPLLLGLDGKEKMSKSLGNYIGIAEEPKDMFGKIMSIPDNLMWEYFRLLTDYSVEEAKKLHPKEAKLLLAEEIVSHYYSKEIALREKIEFEKVFSRREIPVDIPVYKSSKKRLDLLEVLTRAKVVSSKNEVRRLLAQKAISIIEEQKHLKEEALKETHLEMNSTQIVLKIGKRKFLKIIKEG